MKNDGYVSTGKAAKLLGVTNSTLIRWDKSGKLKSERTPQGRRRYRFEDICRFNPLHEKDQLMGKKTICYARVSSYDQKGDLDRQGKVLEMYCCAKGYTYELITDLGSGMNYNKKGLKKLLDDILDDKVGRLVITHKDRLLRFGAELIFSICEAKNVEVIIINSGEVPKSYEEELSSDIIEIITVFSARLYGARSHKNKRIIDGIEQVIKDVKDT
jgi:excisionase family DNA binding protein